MIDEQIADDDRRTAEGRSFGNTDIPWHRKHHDVGNRSRIRAPEQIFTWEPRSRLKESFVIPIDITNESVKIHRRDHRLDAGYLFRTVQTVQARGGLR